MAKTINLELQKDTEDDFYNVETTNSNLDKIDAVVGELNKNLGDIENLSAGSATDIVSAVNSAFQSASDGKTKISNAITGVDDKVVIPTNATFQQLANCIGQIETGVDTIDATATAEQILLGMTAYVNGVKVAGNMANNGAVTITPGTANKTITKGYHNGSGIVSGDTNLITDNIKSGKSIFGVAGKSTVVDTTDASLDPQYLLAGQSGYDDGVLKAGSMTNNGAVVITPGTSNKAIAKGYHNGSGYVVGDANLIASNILSGVSILGVVGTATKGNYATGTVTVSSSSNPSRNFMRGDGVAFASQSYATISLSFIPNIIILSSDSSDGMYMSIYSKERISIGSTYIYATMFRSMDTPANAPSYNFGIQNIADDTNRIYYIPVQLASNTSYTYWAY